MHTNIKSLFIDSGEKMYIEGCAAPILFLTGNGTAILQSLDCEVIAHGSLRIIASTLAKITAYDNVVVEASESNVDLCGHAICRVMSDNTVRARDYSVIRLIGNRNTVVVADNSDCLIVEDGINNRIVTLDKGYVHHNEGGGMFQKYCTKNKVSQCY